MWVSLVKIASAAADAILVLLGIVSYKIENKSTMLTIFILIS